MLYSILENILPFSFLVLSFQIFMKVLVLRFQGINPGSKKSKKSVKKYLIYILFLLIFHLWIFELGKPFLKLSPLPEFLSEAVFYSEVLKMIGAILILFSLILMIFTLIHFSKSLRFGLNSENLGKLVTNGIFSISRNPFFLSLNVYFLGIVFVRPSVFFIGFTLVAILSIHFFILKEEKFMKKNYGVEYEKYAEKVRRYF